MNLLEEDKQKVCDDMMRISESLRIVKDSKEKNSELFNTTLDLLSREVDRLFLDFQQMFDLKKEKDDTT